MQKYVNFGLSSQTTTESSTRSAGEDSTRKARDGKKGEGMAETLRGKFQSPSSCRWTLTEFTAR